MNPQFVRYTATVPRTSFPPPKSLCCSLCKGFSHLISIVFYTSLQKLANHLFTAKEGKVPNTSHYLAYMVGIEGNASSSSSKAMPFNGNPITARNHINPWKVGHTIWCEPLVMESASFWWWVVLINLPAPGMCPPSRMFRTVLSPHCSEWQEVPHRHPEPHTVARRTGSPRRQWVTWGRPCLAKWCSETAEFAWSHHSEIGRYFKIKRWHFNCLVILQHHHAASSGLVASPNPIAAIPFARASGKDYFRTTIFFPANFVTLFAVIWLDGEHYFSAGTYTPNNIKL